MKPWLLLLLALVPGCFSLTPADGTVRCSSSTDPSSLCPTGYACVGGFCWSHLPDGGLDAGVD
jgi:hypothetical protein